MNVTAESYGRTVLLNINGELAVDDLSALQQAVDHQMATQEVVDIVLNMEQSPFIDSAILEYLLDLQDKLIGRLGQIKFAGCDENIMKILEITRLQNDFEVFSEVAEAVKTMAP